LEIARIAMSEQSQEKQISLQLEIDINPQKLSSDKKFEQAKKLALELKEASTGFEKTVQEILYSDDQVDNLDELAKKLDKSFSRKETLKIQICYLLDRNSSMTIANLYESLGSSIKGTSTISQGYNRIIWDDINEDGIEALIELDEEQWIEFEAISPEEFLGYGSSLKESLATLPIAKSIKTWDKDYKNPRWLPVKYNVGLRLIATRFFCEKLKSAANSSEYLINENSILIIDKFANPEEINDERQRVLQSIVLRQGQPQFRESLLEAYNCKCAITDCDVQEALEAVHIIPYLGVETNHLSNGLILRADLHTLFDLFMFAIEPKSLKIIISPRLRNTFYEQLEGKRIRERKKGYIDISKGALSHHFNQCEWLKT